MLEPNRGVEATNDEVQPAVTEEEKSFHKWLNEVLKERLPAKIDASWLVGMCVLVGSAVLLEGVAYNLAASGVSWLLWYLPIGTAIRQAFGGTKQAFDFLSDLANGNVNVDLSALQKEMEKLSTNLQNLPINPVRQIMYEIFKKLGLVEALGGH